MRSSLLTYLTPTRAEALAALRRKRSGARRDQDRAAVRRNSRVTERPSPDQAFAAWMNAEKKGIIEAVSGGPVWHWPDSGIGNARTRLAGYLQGSLDEISLLEEELRIKDARMAMIGAHRRPHDRPIERMAILELKAARGWSQDETARCFLVKPTTIASWLRRIDDAGAAPLGHATRRAFRGSQT